MADEQVDIVIRATDQASGTLRNIGNGLRGLGRMGTGTGALQDLGNIFSRGFSSAAANIERWARRIAIATIGAGTAAVHWSVDFQRNMALIETQAGASHDEVVSMTKAVRDMSSEVATTPIELSKMLYHIESAGIRGSKALEILHTAALGVKVGFTDDAESVANAMIAIQQSGVGGVNSMEMAMSTLDAIVGNGNMRMADLADAMSTGVLGTAKAFSVSLQSVGAALALLTDTGVPAQNAATRLTHSIVMMGAPTKQATKELKALGMTHFEMATLMRGPNGISAALTDLAAHLEKNGMLINGVLTPQGNAAIAKMFGGSRFSATILQLMGQLGLLDQKYANIIAKQDSFGQRVDATSKTAGFQFEQLGANIQNIGIGIGDALVPGLLRINTALNTFINDHKSGIDELSAKIGGWFDKFVDKMLAVDWGKVADGFGKVADMVGSIIQAFMAAPDWVKEVLIGGFALNKLTGGMVGDLAGWGIKNTLGAGSNILMSILGRAGPLGQMISSVGATRVFVVNWPMGGLGGGGGLPGAGGAAGIGFGAITAASGVALVAALAATYYGKVLPELNNAAGANIAKTRSFEQTATNQQLIDAINGLKAMPDKLDPLKRALYEGNASGVKTHTEAEIASLQAELDRRLRTPGASIYQHHDAPGSQTGRRAGSTAVEQERARRMAADRAQAAQLAEIQRHNAAEHQGIDELLGRSSAWAPTEQHGRDIKAETARVRDRANAINQSTQGVARDARSGLSSVQMREREIIAKLGTVGAEIVSAVINSQPIINATTINRTSTVRGRYGPPSGSSQQDDTNNGYSSGRT